MTHVRWQWMAASSQKGRQHDHASTVDRERSWRARSCARGGCTTTQWTRRSWAHDAWVIDT
eukprot:1221897-Alexandrium_andersonii.AAC.1